jgi:ribosome-associated protein
MTEKKTAKKAPKKPVSATPRAPRKKVRPAPNHNKENALWAGELALEKKATNVKLMDVSEITSMTDYFVIASASSDVQVKAIADHILTSMREKHDVAPWKSEGWDTRQWIIIDYVDFVVHIFLETAREFYNLERLWGDAPTEIIEDKPVKKPRAKKLAA